MRSLPEGLPGALTLPKPERLTLADKWILTRLHDTIRPRSSASFDAFDFGVATETIWRFVWYEFCDWYLEATKEPGNLATRAAVLSFVLEQRDALAASRSRRSSAKRCGSRYRTMV